MVDCSVCLVQKYETDDAMWPEEMKERVQERPKRKRDN